MKNKEKLKENVLSGSNISLMCMHANWFQLCLILQPYGQ